MALLQCLGGVRLLVPESYAEEAKGLLTQDFSQELEQQFGASESCPNCGSSDIQSYTQGKRPAYLVFYCLVFHSFFIKMERSVKSANIFGASAILVNWQDILNKQTLDQINHFLENIAKFDQ